MLSWCLLRSRSHWIQLSCARRVRRGRNRRWRVERAGTWLLCMWAESCRFFGGAHEGEQGVGLELALEVCLGVHLSLREGHRLATRSTGHRLGLARVLAIQSRRLEGVQSWFAVAGCRGILGGRLSRLQCSLIRHMWSVGGLVEN
jgi:hypothetical protein